MSTPVETICNNLLHSGVSAERLHQLAKACRAIAKAETPILPWLGLVALFRGLAESIDDRPVPTSEVERLAARLRPILEMLSKPFDGPATLEQAIVPLRDLL